MDTELRRRLLKEVEPEVQELSSLPGPDLVLWCKGDHRNVRSPVGRLYVARVTK